MARIDRKDVEHVANLARLTLTSEEIDRFAQQLGQILEYASSLDALDTEGVEPMAHAVPLKNVLRPDEPRPSLPRERALQNAPHEQDGYFRVPRILEE